MFRSWRSRPIDLGMSLGPICHWANQRCLWISGIFRLRSVRLMFFESRCLWDRNFKEPGTSLGQVTLSQGCHYVFSILLLNVPVQLPNLKMLYLTFDSILGRGSQAGKLYSKCAPVPQANDKKASAQFQVLSLQIHMAGCVRYSCLCLWKA